MELTSLDLPIGDDVVFKDSSFFTEHGTDYALPSPAQVRAFATNVFSSDPRPPPMRFTALNLIVKYGPQITIAEGQCLWAIKHLLGDKVPVPEVYGWYRDGADVFIYMELIHGVTLQERWMALSMDEKETICKQLREMLSAIRQLEQGSEDSCLGSISHQAFQDIIFTSSCSPSAGPFPCIAEFHDYFTHPKLPPDALPHPLRSKLPDEVPIVFTHGDLHPSNIIVSSADNPQTQVLAIVDWHQSGWYPAYWEYCKARWTSEIGSEWESEYLPKILDTYGQYYPIFDYFVLKLGL